MSEKPTQSNEDNQERNPIIDQINEVCTVIAISWLNGDTSTQESLIAGNAALTAWNAIEEKDKKDKNDEVE